VGKSAHIFFLDGGSSFGVRFGYILIGHTYNFTSRKHVLTTQLTKRISDFGFEMGRIGRSLAEGQGFSNPFNEKYWADRLGTAALSFVDAQAFSDCSELQPGFGGGPAKS